MNKEELYQYLMLYVQGTKEPRTEKIKMLLEDLIEEYNAMYPKAKIGLTRL